MSRQLKAILWKNWLLKVTHPWSTAAELLLPVIFMALLILIKQITSSYDSPNVAYSCGNAFPWSYTSSFNSNNILDPSSAVNCLIKPDTCHEANYYQSGFHIENVDALEDVKLYSEYGYIDSASSSGASSNPFYTFTIADETSIYQQTGTDNPSLPLWYVLYRLQLNKAILAIAPSKYSDELYQQSGKLKAYFLSQTSQSFSNTIVLFKSKNDMDNYMTNEDYDDENYKNGKIGLGILLYEADVANKQWDYAIRCNYTYPYEADNVDTVDCLYGNGSPYNGKKLSCDYTYTIPSTQYYTEDLYKPQSSEFLYGYTYSGFSTLQLMVDKYIFSQYGQDVNVMASVGLMPTKKYKTDDFQYVIASTLGIFYMLSFLYPVSRIIRGLVLEKEQRIKEGMKMMGLSEFSYNLSWLITTLVQMAVVSLLIMLVTMSTVFEYSDKFLVFIYFMSFSLAVINMCFLMATFFSRSKVASLMGPMIFFASFFPYYAVSDPSYSSGVKSATCLLAPSCFALGANVFANYEGGLVGVQFSNSSVETSNFSYSLCVGMMIVDAVLYGVLAWYLDKVLPSEFGTQLPVYFPFLPSYWCGVKITREVVDIETLRKQLINAESNGDAKIEAVSSDLLRQQEENRCIMIRDLRKVFETTSEDRVAVKGLNLDIYEGQCTVLLGHNGAGKSTTISMLTGLISPTSGDAIIEGKRISSDMGIIRQSLGVCPQHDILFPELTVIQHLQMFATFKGVPPNEVQSAAEKMIREVGLKEKTHVKSSMLSGGQKRKLSVGIALIGDSKIVILDEPTSGMDPYSRRSTWNIIQRNKKGRVILMTTHFMDEADILGDRIAIMAEGQLRCVGSSLFLKKNYGVGYTFTIVKNHQGQGGSAIRDLVTRFVPEAEALSNVGAEQSYRLPFSATPVFVDLFSEMDSQKNNLGISEYGISVTTLEEVFIRVGKNIEEVHDRQSITEFVEDKKLSVDKLNGNNNNGNNGNNNNNNNNNGSIITDSPFHMNQEITKGNGIYNNTNNNNNNNTNNTNGKYDGVGSLETDSDSVVFFKHFRALFMKRFIYGKRDRRMFLCQMVLPVLLVILGLGLLQLEPDFNQPSLKLTPNQYNPTLDKIHRNYVPFNTESGSFGELIMERFNGDNDNGVYGVAVPISMEDDQFSNCSQGSVSLLNMSNYLIKNLKPKNDHGSSKYGSITIAEESNSTNLSYNILVNGSAVHGVGIYMNLVHEAFLQVLTNTPKAVITVRNFPLPRTWQQENNSASIDAFTAALFFMIAFCFIPASYASFIVKEREVKAKHQQIISGVSIYAYWCSSFVWDVISYLPTVGLVFAIIAAFGVDNYIKNDGGRATFLLFLLYGPAVASFTYLMSFLFRSHSTAQLIVMFFNFLSGLCLMVVSFVLTTINSTESVAVDLRYLFRLFPSFCLGDGLTQLALCDNGNDCPNINRNGYDFDNLVNPFNWNVVGANLFFLAIETVVYFGLAVLTEYSLTFPSLLAWLHRVDDSGFDINKIVEDEDVASERERVRRGQADNDVVRISEMRKVYPSPIGKKVAVQCLSFGIPKGECFGFLGINGAGKTTTLSILSGEFPPTSGTAFIDGYNIQVDQSKIRRKIGYCPQFDALLELLTVREHLELYGRIKGLEGNDLERVVRGKLEQMDLVDFENKAAGSLSGGNKRKLSVAIAMIGEPSIVFLDEPSTGMDPVARRFMWQVISRISTQDALCSIILTTHSMEEAEALCTRIGIMVNGSLRCLGSGQHLKQRYGDGYEVDIKIKFANIESMCVLVDQLKEAGIIKLNNDNTSPIHDEESIDNSNIKSDIHIYYKTKITCDLNDVCNALMEPNRMKLITPNGEGGSIYDMKQTDGEVVLHTFLEWWIAQDDAIRLESFMNKYFPGTILLERSTTHSFRYRIPTKEMSLSNVFRQFEESKSYLNIEDYSVGQTTLEQIFNQFAASQDNPEMDNQYNSGSNTNRKSSSRESFGVTKESPAFSRTNSSAPKIF